jgi:predicted dehydrogenase
MGAGADTRTVRFGLIGAGKIAGRHAAILADLPGARIVAVCDTDEPRAVSLAAEHGARAHADHRDLLAARDVDAVTVATPSGTHAAIALDAARAGKHVVVEKPLALRLEDADAVVEACARAGVRLFEVKQNRYNPPVRRLHEAVRQGRLGRITLATARVRWCRPARYYTEGGWRGTWAEDGGVIANQAIHHIDLLVWLAGDLEAVIARGATALAPIETEDVGVALLRFRSGALGALEATTTARPRDLESSISVLGDRGTVEIAGVALDTVRVWAIDPMTEDDERVLREFSAPSPAVLKQGHQAFYRDVLRSLAGEKPEVVVDGREARRALEALTAIYESLETGEEVHLPFTPARCRLGQADRARG